MHPMDSVYMAAKLDITNNTALTNVMTIVLVVTLTMVAWMVASPDIMGTTAV